MTITSRVKRDRFGRFVVGGESPRKGVYKARREGKCLVCKKTYYTYHKIQHTCSKKCQGKMRAFWNGDRNSYWRIHRMVRKERGSPSKCEFCKSTTKSRYDWANVSGDYENVKDYIRLCRTCHLQYDFNRMYEKYYNN